jgi:hypothetical protein
MGHAKVSVTRKIKNKNVLEYAVNFQKNVSTENAKTTVNFFFVE